MTDASRNLLLHGATSPPPELRLLRAGPVVAMLDGVDLRYVRIAGTELVRRVYVAVRDRNWNTIGGHVSELDVVSSDDGFEVRFEVRHTSHDVEFSWLGEITGESSGRITYGLDGRAEQELVYNRIGLCVHHPWRESAGRPVRARTPDGEVDGEFPTLIGRQRFEGGTYHPLFPSFDRLELDLAGGGSLLFEFEGDLWETEDHRNWTDANFKTYSTPVSQGIPHELAEGEPLRQRLTITPSGFQAESDGLGGQVRLTIGGPTGTRVPAIGLDRKSVV